MKFDLKKLIDSKAKIVIGLSLLGAIVAAVGVSLYFYYGGEEKSQGSESQTKVEGVELISNSSQIAIEVDEGEKTSADITVENRSGDDALVNLYKTNNPYPTDNPTEVLKRDMLVEGLLNYKKNKIGAEAKITDLAKANLVTGVSWLALSPFFDEIKSKQKSSFKLNLTAEDLAPGDYQTNLLILGKDREQSLIVPVNLKVKPAAKIRFASLEIMDGASSKTSGNADHVATAGEKIILNLKLNNSGQADGHNLSLILNPLDASTQILGSNTAEISSLAAGQETTVSFLIQISNQADLTFPPTMEMVIKDGSGKERRDNFYLGEEGKFNYPTGAKKKQ